MNTEKWVIEFDTQTGVATGTPVRYVEQPIKTDHSLFISVTLFAVMVIITITSLAFLKKKSMRYDG